MDLKRLCMLGAALLAGAAAEAKQPNFVFFLVDDLGTGDVGCFGSTFHETPNIDALCAQGMKFTQAYSACTVCSPSRAAILTGRAPGRLHLTDWIDGHKKPFAKLAVPDWKMQIDHGLTTLPEALGAGGYDSLFVGKWHLMPNPQPELWPAHTPEKHGFGGNIGGREWGQPKGPGKYFHPFGMPNLVGKPGDFLTDCLTDAALEYLARAKEKPFLLYMSYYAVHAPIMCKPEYEDYFQRKLDAAPKGTYPQSNPKYAGLMKSVDDSVGRIVQALRDKGELENTVFVFTGDNGGLPDTSSGDLRGTKGTAFEGGTRVPTFMAWPGTIQPGRCDVPVIGMDFYPTLLELAGLPPKPAEHVDGTSLVPLLKRSGPLADRELYWHYPHYHKTNPYGAVRSSNWKLIEFFEDGELMLFDLAKDPTEQDNLAQSHPEKAQELLAKMRAWRKAVDAQMPSPNPAYDPEKAEGKKKDSNKTKKKK